MRDAVGIGHVVLGAIGVGGALFGIAMGVDLAGIRGVVVFGLLAAIGVVTALAGMWLKDGQRRGAILAGVLDLGRVLLLLAWPHTRMLDLLLTVALLGGVVWVLPTLSDEDAVRPSRG